nr:unnamed protein product [Haemonchus contortus]
MVTHGVAFVAHMIGNLIITINRFSILCLKKDSFWTRKNVRIIICLQYACAFAALSPVIGVDMVYVKNSDGSYSILGISKEDDLINQCTYLGAAVLYAVVGLILNVKVLVCLHGMLKLSNSARMAVHEKGMVFCTLVVFGFTMLMCILQILRGIAILTENTEIFNSTTMNYYWINDIMVSIPPCTQLVLNSELRRDIINFVRCRRHPRNLVTSAMMFSSQYPRFDRSSYQGRRCEASAKF